MAPSNLRPSDDAAASSALAQALLEGIGPCDLAVRTQVAFVRTLVDELARRQRSGQNVTSTCDQLDEEVARLRYLLGAAPVARSQASERPSVACCLAAGSEERDRHAEGS